MGSILDISEKRVGGGKGLAPQKGYACLRSASIYHSHLCATNDWAPWLCIASFLAYALLLTQPPQDHGYSITPERFLYQQQAGGRWLILSHLPVSDATTACSEVFFHSLNNLAFLVCPSPLAFKILFNCLRLKLMPWLNTENNKISVYSSPRW